LRGKLHKNYYIIYIVLWNSSNNYVLYCCSGSWDD